MDIKDSSIIASSQYDDTFIAATPGIKSAKKANRIELVYNERDREHFYKDLKAFHENRNTPITRFPRINGKHVDLYLLYTEVIKRGGWMKVNSRNEWENLIRIINLKTKCVNVSVALKHIYTRYLDKYEKLNYFGEDPDRIDQPEDESLSSRHRRWSAKSIHSVPMKYNHTQHNVSEQVRILNKLSTDLYKSSEYDKLLLSLMSPLPNEQDFAINVCTLMANESKHTLRINQCPKLLDALLAHAGVFTHFTTRELFHELYTNVRKHSLQSFWTDCLYEKPFILELSYEDYFQSPSGNITIDTNCRPPLRLTYQERFDDGLTATAEECRSMDFLSLKRGLGTQDYVGQRVSQIISILRNLSFFEENMSTLAENKTFIRFIVMSSNIRWGNIHQMALDVCGNIAVKIELSDPSTDDITRCLLLTICEGLEGQDRGVIINCLEILTKLCQKDSNALHLMKSLEQKVYNQICLYLSLNDIMLLLYTLECVYALTSFGSKSCNAIMQIKGIVDTLVSLITVEAQSYGPDGCILMRVVETVPGNMLPMVAQNIANLQNAAMSGTIPEPPKFTGNILNQAAAAVTNARVNQQPMVSPKEPLQTTTLKQENEQFALTWLAANFECTTVVESRIEQHELYKMYTTATQKGNRRGQINAVSFPRLVRTVFGTNVGPNLIKTTDSNGIETNTYYYVCLRAKANPLPMQHQKGMIIPQNIPSIKSGGHQIIQQYPKITQAETNPSSIPCQNDALKMMPPPVIQNSIKINNKTNSDEKINNKPMVIGKNAKKKQEQIKTQNLVQQHQQQQIQLNDIQPKQQPPQSQVSIQVNQTITGTAEQQQIQHPQQQLQQPQQQMQQPQLQMQQPQQQMQQPQQQMQQPQQQVQQPQQQVQQPQQQMQQPQQQMQQPQQQMQQPQQQIQQPTQQIQQPQQQMQQQQQQHKQQQQIQYPQQMQQQHQIQHSQQIVVVQNQSAPALNANTISNQVIPTKPLQKQQSSSSSSLTTPSGSIQKQSLQHPPKQQQKTVILTQQQQQQLKNFSGTTIPAVSSFQSNGVSDALLTFSSSTTAASSTTVLSTTPSSSYSQTSLVKSLLANKVTTTTPTATDVNDVVTNASAAPNNPSCLITQNVNLHQVAQRQHLQKQKQLQQQQQQIKQHNIQSLTTTNAINALVSSIAPATAVKVGQTTIKPITSNAVIPTQVLEKKIITVAPSEPEITVVNKSGWDLVPPLIPINQQPRQPTVVNITTTSTGIILQQQQQQQSCIVSDDSDSIASTILNSSQMNSMDDTDATFISFEGVLLPKSLSRSSSTIDDENLNSKDNNYCTGKQTSSSSSQNTLFISANQMLVDLLDKKSSDPPPIININSGIKRKLEDEFDNCNFNKKQRAFETKNNDNEDDITVTPSKNAANLYAEIAASILEDEDLQEEQTIEIQQAPEIHQSPQSQTMLQIPSLPHLQVQATSNASVNQQIHSQTVMQKPPEPSKQVITMPVQRQIFVTPNNQMLITPNATTNQTQTTATIKTDAGLQTIPVILQKQIVAGGQQILQPVIQQSAPAPTTQYMLATNPQGQTYLLAQQQPNPQQPPTVLLAQTPQQQGTPTKTIIILQQPGGPPQPVAQQQIINSPGGTQKMIMTTQQGQQMILTTQMPRTVTHSPQLVVNHPMSNSVRPATANVMITQPQQQSQLQIQTQAASIPPPPPPPPSILHQPSQQFQIHYQQQVPSQIQKQKAQTQQNPNATINITQQQQQQQQQQPTTFQLPHIPATIKLHTPQTAPANMHSSAIITSQTQTMTVANKSLQISKPTQPSSASISLIPFQQTTTTTQLIKKPLIQTATIQQQSQNNINNAIIAVTKTDANTIPSSSSSILNTQHTPQGNSLTIKITPNPQPSPQSTIQVPSSITPPPPPPPPSSQKPPLVLTQAPLMSPPHLTQPQLPSPQLPQSPQSSSPFPPQTSDNESSIAAKSISNEFINTSLASNIVGVQQNVPILDASQQQQSSSMTQKFKSVNDEDDFDISWPWICEWRNCQRMKFKSVNEVYRHACIAHCPDNIDPAAEIYCQWSSGTNLCDNIPRKRFSLMTHLLDRHCTTEALKAAAQRRIASGIMPATTGQPVTIVKTVTTPSTIGNNNNNNVNKDVDPPLIGSMLPATSAALQAIKRHTPDFMNSKELMDENEGPVTKSIRLSAALILRNLVTHTTTAKRLVRHYESHLAGVALSNVESSRTISQILFELNN